VAKAKTPPRFVAEVLVTSLVEIPLGGKTLVEAMANAKNVKRSDAVEIVGDYMDGNFKVTGVRDDTAWGKLEIE
jgi:hypothetical protein